MWELYLFINCNHSLVMGTRVQQNSTKIYYKDQLTLGKVQHNLLLIK